MPDKLVFTYKFGTLMKTYQFSECSEYNRFLPSVALIESNLLAIGDDSRVYVAILAF